MTRLRPFLACLLALILMSGSVAMAVARSEMAGASEVILCGGDPATPQQIGADGKPLKPAHACPHCLAAAAVADLPTAPAIPGPASRITTLKPAAIVALSPAQIPAPTARGPPLTA